MAQTRYSESRTLVRGLCRLRGRSRAEFKRHVLRLRRQFEQFNLDTSELCQCLMGLRPGGKQSNEQTERFWEFFLEPQKFFENDDQDGLDRYRRTVFDVAAGWEPETSLTDIPICRKLELLESVRSVAALPRSATAEKSSGGWPDAFVTKR